jgi:glycosyltransferase involved in cell wall biosynthesis
MDHRPTVTPIISFVVPVRDDAVRLETCLQSILRNQERRASIEIVVVDNGSTDASPDVARRLGARVLVIEDAPVSELRNVGARHASAPLLAFVDADNEIVPGWVDAACDTLAAHNVGAVGALYQAPLDGTWVQHAYGMLRGRAQGRHDVDWLCSGNLVVPRRAFDAIGGFDTSLEACEDVDFCNRLRAKGLRIVSDARMQSVHHGDARTLRHLFRSELWRGRDNLRVSFRRPVSWPAVPSALLPVLDLALLGTTVLGVAGWLTVWPSGVWLALAAMLAIAIAASLRTLRAAAKQAPVAGAGVLQSFVVIFVYDIARALALVTRAPHRTARPGAAPVES